MKLLDDLDHLYRNQDPGFALLMIQAWPAIQRVIRAEMSEQELPELECDYDDDAEKQELFGLALKAHNAKFAEEVLKRTNNSIVAWLALATLSEAMEAK